MAITNLRGTKWLLPLAVQFDQQAPFHGADINFTSNNTNYAYLDVGDEQDDYIKYGTDSSTLTTVYDGGVWADNAYRVVTITGGDDVTDEYVIDWFTTTATDITPNVVLKNESGTALQYSNVSKVALENAEGGTTKFSLPPTEQLAITQNGVYDTLQYNSVNVNVSATYPETPTDSLLFYSPNEISIQTFNKAKGWNGTLYYSVDHSTWNVWDGKRIVSALNNGWHTLYLRGVGNTKIASNNDNFRFVFVGTSIKCVGNCNNLLDYTTTPTLDTGAFGYLFAGCGNCDFDVTLPSTSLSKNCYKSMFSGCSSLTKAPALPATTLAEACYMQMFEKCASLTKAPALPATTLATQCYQNMFNSCVALRSLPALPATTLANTCYYYMFAYADIKLSTTQTGDYQTPYRSPTSDEGTTATNALNYMFANTGGTFTGTPTINTTYYTSNEVIPAT